MVSSSKKRMTADVVVIGGGMMGTSILYNLAERGMKRSVLLEREVLGSGSTGRSSGIVHLFTDPEEARARLTLESLNIYRNFSEIVGGGDAGFVNTGFLITVSKTEAEEAKEHVIRQQKLGVSTMFISREEGRELAPSFAFADDETLFWEPETGYGDPYKVTSAYVIRAKEMGARVELDLPALGIEVEGGHVVAVKTAQGRLETPNVIVATGPWSAKFLSKIGISLPLQPTLAEVFVLRRPTDLNPTHVGGSDAVNGIYFRPHGTNYTLVGGGATPGNIDPDSYIQHPTQQTIERHWSALNRRVPLMKNAELFRGYTGVYTVTPDQMPVIDKLSDIEGLFVCTGFSGRGFKLAPAVGKVVADLVVDGTSRFADISSMKFDRF